ncbi:hypothetical protein P692DRAFT_20876421 [Suillus brevipes Sb2]|nr:hypothetical protein P692DRAFT_20876421 [Suillus brevipes Sb2]
MTLGNHSALGLDPTIHVCNTLRSVTAHPNLLGGVDSMPTEAVGWVIGDEGEDKDGQEYALKDCWVDAEKLEQEVDFLRAVNGAPNVIRLRKYWDIKYDGRVDSTSHIHDHVHNHLPDSLSHAFDSLRTPQDGGCVHSCARYPGGTMPTLFDPPHQHGSSGTYQRMILYPKSITTAGLFEWILSAGGNLSNNASSWALFIPDSRLERASLYWMIDVQFDCIKGSWSDDLVYDISGFTHSGVDRRGP